MSGRVYTRDMQEFFKTFTPGHHVREITDEFNRRFYPEEVSFSQVRSYIRNHKIKTGYTGRFGAERQSGWHCVFDRNGVFIGKNTQFKKGSVSYNHVEVGTVRTRSRKSRNAPPEVFIKVAEPNKWELYGRYLWKQAHGEIPTGYVVAFRDGDTTNVVLENLRLVSKSAMQTVCVLNAPKGKARDTALSIGELKYQINRRQKHHADKRRTEDATGVTS